MNLNTLKSFKRELESELEELLNWWIKYVYDKENRCFYGEVDNDNHANLSAPKGLVMHARILYTFSSAYLLNNNPRYLEIAEHAYHHLKTYFLDAQHGGFYWSLTAENIPLDQKKQAYGQAFTIYALAEFNKATANQEALALAQSTFHLLEKHSFDPINLGYLEASSREWNTLNDLRLSDKDMNEKKSMNTHLHIIEAYANLYTVWQNEDLKQAINQLLDNFSHHIINEKKSFLNLFFTENWVNKSTVISFGHDIEASWLLHESALIIKEKVSGFEETALNLAKGTLLGLDQQGGLFYELDTEQQHYIKEFHWWPQAEAMVGFFNAWQISKESHYLATAFKSWEFIKTNIKDLNNGEWFWGLNSDYSIMQNQEKAGFWKCPYHNGRACIELIKRISNLLR